MTVEEIIKKLKTYDSAKNREGMTRFGITGKKIIGGPNMPALRKMGREIGKNHQLALELWNSEIYEARMLAAFVDDPAEVTESQMEEWVGDFDSWAICDTVCGSLLDKPPFAHKKALQFVKNDEEFVRRAGFVIITWLAVHDKKLDDEVFIKFLPTIKKYSTDDRNFVRKAVNWCLRTIGKRNKELNKKAIEAAEEINQINSKSARWIANDAIRELNNNSTLVKITPVN